MDHTRRYFRVKRLATEIALLGGRREGGVWEAPWIPACDRPVWVLLSTPRTSGQMRFAQDMRRPYDVGMFVPCRNCPQCLRIRQMQWRERIVAEANAHTYSYFLTLTFSPAHLAGVLAEATQVKAQGRSAVEQAAYKHVSQYFKRLRKGRKHASRGDSEGSLGRTRQAFAPLKFRFFAAMEYGEERGRLHFHAMLHLQSYVPTEIFTTEWRSRADAELVRSREGCATYVSKYLTKDQVPGRARASLRYGKQTPTTGTKSAQSGEAEGQPAMGGEGEHVVVPPANFARSRGYTPPSRPSQRSRDHA